MIQMPYEDILAKIKEKTDLSGVELEQRITSKLEQLSGLISREGAAHIVANELGVRLVPSTNGRLKIKDILTGMRSVEVVGKVMAVYEIREFTSGERQGKVGNFILGDESGTIRCVAWGEQAEELKKLTNEVIVMIKGGYVRENQGRKEIHLNDNSQIFLNPKGETVGEVPAMQGPARKKLHDLTDQDQNVEVIGTIVQAFEPKFFEVCPQCGKRARPQDEGFQCAAHGIVNPEYSYVMNVILDDGTDTMRIVCFRQQLLQLLSKTEEQVLVYRTSPQLFDEVKQDLLGTIMKFRGRVKKNEMFARLEFNTFNVDPNPNPEEEIKRLKESAESTGGKTVEESETAVEEVV